MKAITLLLAVLFVAVASPADARKTFQNWWVESYPGVHEAWTASAGSATFGILCFEKEQQCLYYVSDANTTCTVGKSVIALVNAEAGSISLEGICSKLEDGRHLMVLSPFDSVETALKRGGLLGIAIPMESGTFRVFRFNLAGSAQAIAATKDAATRGEPGMGDVEI